MTRFESKSKPKKCPQCGSGSIAEIQYGMPAFSRELERDLKEGRVILGGCCITDDDPRWQCVECAAEIYGKHPRNDDA